MRKITARLWRRVTRFWDGLFVLGEARARGALAALIDLLRPTREGFPHRLKRRLALEKLEDRWMPAAISAATTLEDTQTTSGLVITPDPANVGITTYYQVTNITRGTLFQHDGTT